MASVRREGVSHREERVDYTVDHFYATVAVQYIRVLYYYSKIRFES